MAAAISRHPSCRGAEEERWTFSSSIWKDKRELDLSRRRARFKHDIIVEPLWMESWGHPSFDHSKGLLKHTSDGTLSTSPIKSLIASLKTCTRNKDLAKGISIHHEVAQKGLLAHCTDALVTMYAQCGELAKAKALIDLHKSEDVISWTALISGYARAGQGQSALDCFEQMRSDGIPPNAVTYICTLKACATIGAVDRGKLIHDEISRQGLLQNDIVLGGALVDMYAKCKAMSEAQQVLEELSCRNVVCWSSLIAGHVQEGQADQALDCLEQMQRERILPDAVAYISALNACAILKAYDRGMQIHHEIIMQGLLFNDVMLNGALVDMYAKCGALLEARKVLEGLPSRSVASWNALMAGYVQKGEAEQALACLERMQLERVCPNAVTYACALKACALIKAIDKGKQIHVEIVRQGLLKNNLVLGNALMDMYAKWSDLSEARHTLKDLPVRDVVTWNIMIGAYVQEGETQQAHACFEQMQHEGIVPDAATFASVLNMHSHQGQVEEGETLFLSMGSKYGVKPSLECYNCMINLFGRAGLLDKAVKLIQDMRSSEHTAIWHTLLGICQTWADVKVGKWAFEQALKLDMRDESAYVFMGNIYAAAGMEEEAKTIEAMRIRNKAGRYSW